jgi:hypothetical protein
VLSTHRCVGRTLIVVLSCGSAGSGTFSSAHEAGAPLDARADDSTLLRSARMRSRSA